jgi:hypothetical protein
MTLVSIIYVIICTVCLNVKIIGNSGNIGCDGKEVNATAESDSRLLARILSGSYLLCSNTWQHAHFSIKLDKC